MEYGVYGDVTITYPKPYSIYFRGTMSPLRAAQVAGEDAFWTFSDALMAQAGLVRKDSGSAGSSALADKMSSPGYASAANYVETFFFR